MKAGRAAGRLAGAFLLVVPFLPLRRLFGEVKGGTFLAHPMEWVSGAALFGGGAWLLSLLLPAEWPGRLYERVARWSARVRMPILLGLLLASLLGLASAGVFRGKPLLVDSVAQLFQARIFAAGAVSAPGPPNPPFFLIQHLLVDGGRWYSQYPPGHAALLAIGLRLGAAWAVPLLLSLGTSLFLFRFSRTVYGETTALWTLFLLILSPFFWFMGASYMNHVSCLFFLALGLYVWARWEQGAGSGWLAGAGAALGGAFLSRPLTALAAAAVLAPMATAAAWRRGRLAHLAGGAAGFLAVASLYLLYNAWTTGDPLLPGYIRLWGSDHGLGFHATPWGDLHTPRTGLRNELVDLALLNVYLFEWPIPALLPIALFFLAGLGSERWDARLLVGFVAIPAAYFFYWHRDARLGPRFLYGGLVFLIPLTARAIPALLRRLDGLTPARLSRALPGGWAVPAAWLLLLCGGYALAYAVPQRFRVYSSSLPSMREDLAREAAEAGISEGLVFVSVSWGNRLLVRLRDLGLPASLVERAYRSADHCDLELLERRARAEGWDAPTSAREVRRLVGAAAVTLATPEWNGDPTLRLRPDRVLPTACREEIEYDRGGYTVYTPHLLANRPALDGTLVVARDLRDRNSELRARYPGRPAYVYRGGRFVGLW
ncbi:MAG: ArnT family glycosyltransferase [Gemmatimonadota bacterium]